MSLKFSNVISEDNLIIKKLNEKSGWHKTNESDLNTNELIILINYEKYIFIHTLKKIFTKENIEFADCL